MAASGAIRVRWGAAVAALAALALAGPQPARAGSVRVPAEYFGINFQAAGQLGAAERERHLSAIEALGLRTARVNFAWPLIEPEAPAGGSHDYRFERYDAVVGAAARHRIRVLPTIVQSPGWNVSGGLLGVPRCAAASSRRPVSTAPYVDLVAAVARRYGRGGSFWQENPGLRARPIAEYEIWNEPNLSGTWCPEPEPERYGQMLASSMSAIRAVDPLARVYPGGLADPTRPAPEQLTIQEFLRRMLSQRPELRGRLDRIAVHAFTTPIAAGLTRRVAEFRAAVRAGGIPDKTPLIVNEIGWPTRGSAGSVSEAIRKGAYRALVRRLARTNCNIAAVLPHAWTSNEHDPGSSEDWFGIADPVSADPYPSARALGKGVRLLRGRLRREAPVRTIRACGGMRKPNTDGDRRRDERDYFPLKPRRWKPPARVEGWPPGRRHGKR